MPGSLQCSEHSLVRKTLDEFLSRIRQHKLLKLDRKSFTVGIEISRRHGGIRLSFLLEKSPDLSTIFFQESLSKVFRMSLKMQKETLFLFLCERVYSAFFRSCQHAVTTYQQFFRLHFVPTGVREAHLTACATGQVMLSSLDDFENSKLFVSQPMTGDAITVKNAGVRRQTRHDGGGDVSFGPIKDIGQSSPV